MCDDKLMALKQTINQMIEKGMVNEAYDKVSQLIKTMPEDADLNELLSTIRHLKKKSEEDNKNVQVGLNTDSDKNFMNGIDNKTNTENAEISKGKKRVLLLHTFFLRFPVQEFKGQLNL
jgi:hypothetical protein